MDDRGPVDDDRCIAVVPAKRLATAKQRLAAALPADVRRQLAAAMLADVLAALVASEGLAGVVLVTADLEAARLGRVLDRVWVVADVAELGHDLAAAQGIAAARRLGATRVLLLPGDCPTLDPSELDRLLEDPGPQPEVVIVPDRLGDGTNGLLLAPPHAIEPAFGPGSRARYERRAARAGARVRVVAAPTIALDIDTSDDLHALRGALAAGHGGDRTRQVLERLPSGTIVDGPAAVS